MGSSAKIRYSYDMEADWMGPRRNSIIVEEAPMKKLINDEMSKRPSNRQNGPSIVARLMGMDVSPLDTRSTVNPKKKREGLTTVQSCDYEKNINLRGPINCNYSNSTSFEHEFDPTYDCKGSKPKRREHPQEEELQKFKKDFVAWKAARFMECSRYAETEDTSALAITEKAVEPKSHYVKEQSAGRSFSRGSGGKSEIYTAERKELGLLSCKARFTGQEQVPTTIVVLKPGPDKIWSSEDSWTSFSGSSEERGSIEDFLEEVKERLKHELQGKILEKAASVPETRIVGPTCEKMQDPQKIAKQIYNRVRESVTRDLELGPSLVRSESSRSHRSDFQLNDASSPEFINRDTRRFLAERMKNVLRRESDMSTSVGSSRNFSRSKLLDEKSFLTRHEIEENEEEQEELHTRSFRDESMSPKNLIRSLSAPVSGTSFGKLLLEDRHVITGAHIRRRHESSIEGLFAGTKKGKKEKEKEKFSLREKVHNFRSNFTFRGRLFRRRIPSIADLQTCEPSLMKDIMSGPTVILNTGLKYENPTEVPPSPASVCSNSPLEEYWRPSNDLSPESSPERTLVGNGDDSRVLADITSAEDELQEQLSLPEPDMDVQSIRGHRTGEPELPKLEDCTAAYVRTLLVASGMYDGQSGSCFLRWDPLSKPISSCVYEKVEESYTQQDKEENGHGLITGDSERGIKADHRVLYDLLNEALLNLLKPPVISSRYGKKISATYDLQHPCEQRLMDAAWEYVRSYVYPPADASLHYLLDSMMEQDLGSAPWFQLLDEQVDALRADIECSIFGDLLKEILRDIELG